MGIDRVSMLRSKDRPMLHSMGRIAVVAIAILTLGLASQAQEDEEDPGQRILRERLAPVEKRGERAVEKSIIEEIGFLAEMNLGDSARDYYGGLVGRWEKCATERSIPVLEELIKKMAAFKRDRKRGQLPWGIFGTLDRRVHELWYRLKTQDMSPEEKAKVALWGMMEKGAPVPFERELAMVVLPRIGMPAREAVYEFMARPADGEWDDLTASALHSAIGGTPDFNVLSPSEDEIRQMLAAKGTIGNMVVVEYLLCNGRRDVCIQPLLEMLLSGQEDRVSRALYNFYQHIDTHAEQIIPVLIGIGSKNVMFAESRFGGSRPDGDRSDVFDLLGKMGRDARTVKLLNDYVNRICRPQAWIEETVPDNLAARQRAVRAAYSWLKKWGELPVEGDAGKDEEEAVEAPPAEDEALKSMPTVQKPATGPATPASQGHGTWLLVVVGVLSALLSSAATAAIVRGLRSDS